MDADETAICLGCHTPGFLAELSDFWKQSHIWPRRGFQSCPALALELEWGWCRGGAQSSRKELPYLTLHRVPAGQLPALPTEPQLQHAAFS